MAQRSSARPMSGGDESPPRVPIMNRLGPLLAYLAQILSLAGLAGFVAAITLNSLLFRFWGLSFLQTASTSDVILSGLQLAFLLLVPIGGGALGWWIMSRTRERWPSYGVEVLLTFFIATAMVGLALTTSAGFISGDAEIYVAVVGVLVAAWIRLQGPARTVDWWPATRRSGRFRSVILLTLLTIAVVVPAIGQFSLIVREGLVGARLITPQVESCDRPTIMWIGERAVVIRCSPRQMRVLYQAENIQLVPEPRQYRQTPGDRWIRELLRLPAPPAGRR